MSNAFDWDDHKPSGGAYKFHNAGDAIAGVVTEVRVRSFDDGTSSPEVFLTTQGGEAARFFVNQVKLREGMAAVRPSIGDTVAVKMLAEASLAGGKTLKHFAVVVQTQAGEVRRYNSQEGDGVTVTAAAGAPAAPAPAPAPAEAVAPAPAPAGGDPVSALLG